MMTKEEITKEAMRVKQGDWVILVLTDWEYEPVWKELGEGPFSTREMAEEYAESEVGVIWVVAQFAGNAKDGRTGKAVEA